MAASKPKVLMILDAMFFGGTETHVYTLTQSLIKQGVEVSICAGSGPLKSDFEKLSCKVHVVPFIQARTPAARKQLRIKIGQIIRQDGITHMHIHQSHSGFIAYPVARQHRLSVLMTLHGMYYDLAAIKRMKRSGLKVISVSPPLRKWAKQQGLRSHTIPNGISVNRFRPKQHGLAHLRRKLGLREDDKVVVYVGRLGYDKAHVANRVIEACKNLVMSGEKRLVLVIVGSGPQAETVKNSARAAERQAGRSFVRFYGARRHIRPYYVIANCVVGTGRVALEAMACGRPVVAIGVTGVFGRVSPSRLRAAWHYYYGDHIAPYPHNASRLERDIRYILTSANRQQRYGKAGRAFVVERFNSDRIAGEMQQLYRTAPHAR